jgi:uncharacterized protein YkwD
MHSHRSGRARRDPRRRALVTAAAATGAVLAVGTGVALDRVVLPAFGDTGGTTVIAQRDPSPGIGTGPHAKGGAPTGPVNATGPGASGRPAPGRTVQPPKETLPPLKSLHMPDPDGKDKNGPDRDGSGSPGGSGSGGGSGGGSGSGGGTPAPSGAAGLEASVAQLTNSERAKAGCPALRVDQRLVTAARAHSADMAAKGYFSHTSPNGDTFVDRIKRAGYSSPGAENIAKGYSTPAAVMEGWMNSPGHRANILNCGLKAIGVGVQTGSGGPWWTQDFGWS